MNEAGESGWSDTANAPTDTAAPDKPVLTATANGQEVVLSWTVPDNNGSDIANYNIQRLPSINDAGMSQNSWGDDVGTNGRDGEAGTMDEGEGDSDQIIIPLPAGSTTDLYR